MLVYKNDYTVFLFLKMNRMIIIIHCYVNLVIFTIIFGTSIYCVNNNIPNCPFGNIIPKSIYFIMTLIHTSLTILIGMKILEIINSCIILTPYTICGVDSIAWYYLSSMNSYYIVTCILINIDNKYFVYIINYCILSIPMIYVLFINKYRLKYLLPFFAIYINIELLFRATFDWNYEKYVEVVNDNIIHVEEA